jgi:hypothetical protein
MNKSALGVEDWMNKKSLLLEWVDTKWRTVRQSRTIEKDEAYFLIEKHCQLLEDMLYKTAYNLECLPQCPAFCCFFPEDGKVRVPLELDKLSQVKSYIEKKGGKLEDYLELTAVSELNLELRNIVKNPPSSIRYVTTTHGADMVYFLKTNPTRLMDKKFLKNIPSDITRDKMWVDEYSWACMFLSKDYKCLLQDSGAKPTACSSHVCLTALALTLLINMGILDKLSLSNPPDLLNKAAEKIDEILSQQDFKDMEDERDNAFKELVLAFIENNDVNYKKSYYLYVDENYFPKRRHLLEPVILMLSGKLV